MDLWNFEPNPIPEGSDPWQFLPLEQACQAISYITDITDVSRILQTSVGFRQYVHCIQNLTTNRLVTVTSSYLSAFTNLVSVDHKIVVNLDVLPSLPKLQQAHFLIRDVNLLAPLLQNLNRLDYPEHYFKISLVLPDIIMGILILNGRFVIIPPGKNYEQALTQIINQIRPSLVQLTIPNTGQRFNRFVLLRKPMRDFLKTADFGLVDPSNPPSDSNPPLSNYAKILADGAPTGLLLKIFTIYVFYNRLYQIDNPIFINTNQEIRRYFEPQIEANRSKYPNLNMSAMLFAHIQVLISINILDSVTVEDIAEYEFPNIPTLDVINYIDGVTNLTRAIYRQLRNQAQRQYRRTRTSDLTYYATDGTIRNIV